MALYRHFKGGIYEMMGIGTQTETKEEMVIYKSSETGKLFVRNKEMFFNNVLLDGIEVPRFKLMGDD